MQLQCLNGHPVPAGDSFCGVCGASLGITAPLNRSRPLTAFAKLGMAAAVIGLTLAALSIFSSSWFRGSVVSDAAAQNCVDGYLSGRYTNVDDCPLPTSDFSSTRQQFADVLDGFGQADSGFDESTHAFVVWGGVGAVISLAVVAALALGRAIQWVVVAAVAATASFWAAFVSYDIHGHEEIGGLASVGLELGWIGFGVMALAAVVAHRGLSEGPIS